MHNFELYVVMIERYPPNLITKDDWGTLPLLYAIWGSAPSEVVRYLLDGCWSLYHHHVYDWTEMCKMPGRRWTAFGNFPTGRIGHHTSLAVVWLIGMASSTKLQWLLTPIIVADIISLIGIDLLSCAACPSTPRTSGSRSGAIAWWIKFTTPPSSTRKITMLPSLVLFGPSSSVSSRIS